MTKTNILKALIVGSLSAMVLTGCGSEPSMKINGVEVSKKIETLSVSLQGLRGEAMERQCPKYLNPQTAGSLNDKFFGYSFDEHVYQRDDSRIRGDKCRYDIWLKK